MTAFKSLNGYNVPLFEESNDSVSNSVKEINVTSEFLNNCNIMIFIMFGVLVVGGVLFIVGKILALSTLSKTYQISNLLLKQILITIVMFSLLNFSFSAGAHWQYSKG